MSTGSQRPNRYPSIMRLPTTPALAVLVFAGVVHGQVCTSPPPAYALLENPRNTVVRFCTTEGVIDIELFDEQAPITVANFLSYVGSGRYDGTFIDRSSFNQGIPFVLGGGGWSYSAANGLHAVPAYAPIIRENTGRSNVARTLGMARLSSVNSPTSLFFINSVDNLFLDPGGYAVFGRVVQGWNVVTSIQSRPSQDFSNDLAFEPYSSTFFEVPVNASYVEGQPASEGVLIHITDAQIISLPRHCSADFNRDGDTGTDADIEAFFACLAGNCCATCGSADFDADRDVGTDADIEAFFRVLAGGDC